MPEVLTVVYRTILSFLTLFIMTRIVGKQQISQLTFYDFIAGITIGSIAAELAVNVQNRTFPNFIGLVLFVFLTLLASYVALKSRPLRKLLDGEPTIVIQNGKILENNMAKMRYNLDDLMMQLRSKNCFNISDVEYAILETNGELSLLLKSDKLPVTPKDLNIPTQYEGIPSELIMDGKIIYQNLEQNRLNEDWLREELKKKGIKNIKDVSYASLDVNGNLYVDLKDDLITDTVEINDK